MPKKNDEVVTEAMVQAGMDIKRDIHNIMCHDKKKIKELINRISANGDLVYDCAKGKINSITAIYLAMGRAKEHQKIVHKTCSSWGVTACNKDIYTRKPPVCSERWDRVTCPGCLATRKPRNKRHNMVSESPNNPQLIVDKDEVCRKFVAWASSPEGKKRIAADAKVANEFTSSKPLSFETLHRPIRPIRPMRAKRKGK